jgi:hypothetical protein
MGAPVVKRVRKHSTDDFPILMPRPRPPHHEKHRGWWLLLSLLVLALIAWRVILYLR